jgi:hypothetical protein
MSYQSNRQKSIADGLWDDEKSEISLYVITVKKLKLNKIKSCERRRSIETVKFGV